MRGVSETVKHLLIINGIFFFASNLYGAFFNDLMALHFYAHPSFQPWQPLTHMFMHGNFPHLLFNMFGLWMFGSPLEQMWGRQKFLFYYFSAGLGAALLQLLAYHFSFQGIMDSLVGAGNSRDEILQYVQQQRYLTSWLDVVSMDQIARLIESFNASMVGASGALYGILVAFAFLFPNVPLYLIFVPIPIKAKYFVPMLIVGDLFFGFSSYSVGPIAHFAHVGGAITGFLMMMYWKNNQFNQNRWD